MNTYTIHIVGGQPEKFTTQMYLTMESLLFGCTVKRNSATQFEAIKSRSKSLEFSKNRITTMPIATFRSVKDKDQTRTILESQGFPVPEGRTFHSHEAQEALNYAERLGFPVVVKPSNGAKGKGVTANISNPKGLRVAIQSAIDAGFEGGRFIVERHIPGPDLRCFGTRKQAVTVIGRRSTLLVGNGSSTIEELIHERNTKRELNPHLKSRKIKLVNAIPAFEKQNLHPDQVLAAGQQAFVSTVANMHQGGESYEITEDTHPDILRLARSAVEAIPNLEWAGVDIIVNDHRLSLMDQDAAIIEINASPSIRLHAFPAHGKPKNVIRAILKEKLGRPNVIYRRPHGEDWVIKVNLQAVVVKNKSKFKKWIILHSNRLGLDLKIRNRSPFEAEVKGPAARIAMLLCQGFGELKKFSLESITATPHKKRNRVIHWLRKNIKMMRKTKSKEKVRSSTKKNPTINRQIKIIKKTT